MKSVWLCLSFLVAIIAEIGFLVAPSREPQTVESNATDLTDHPLFALEFSRVDSISQTHLTELLQATKENSRDGSAWQQLADGLLVHGYLAEAIAAYELAENFGAGTGERAFWHAVALHQMGKLKNSTSQFELALQHPIPTNLKNFAWYGIGRNALRAEDANQAETSFRNALPLEPAQFELARLLLKQDRTQEAELFLRELLERQPEAHRVLQLLARAVERQERTAEALDLRDRSDRGRDVYPSDALIYLLREKAKQFGSKYVDSLAAKSSAQQRWKEAISLRQTMLDAQWDPVVAFALILDLQRDGQLETARSVAETMLQREGPSPAICGVLADLSEKLGAPEQALAYRLQSHDLQASWQVLEKLADSNMLPNEQRESFRLQMLVRKGFARLQQRDIASSQDLFDRAIELDTNSASAWYGRGEALRLQGQFDDARLAFETALQIDGTDGHAAQRLQQLALFRETFGSR